MMLRWVSGTVFGMFSEPEVKRMAAVSGTGAFQRLRQQRRLISSDQILRQMETPLAIFSSGSRASSRPLKSTPVPLRRSIRASEVRMWVMPAFLTQCFMLRLPTVQLIITGTFPANSVAR